MPTLTPKQLATLEKQAAAGSEARDFLTRSSTTCPTCGAGSTIFREREQHIINEALAWFAAPGSSKDDHVAVRYIAALGAVRELQAALEHRDRKATEAKQTLYGDQTAGA